MTNKLLVDVCCGPCSIPLEDIYDGSDNYEVTFFVSDHNVHPLAEYEKRLDSIKKVASHYHNSVVIEQYDPSGWLEYTKGHENDKENGKRCELCYTHRIERVARYALMHNFTHFTTTLTTGPLKESRIINKIGNTIAKKYGLLFVEHDLKKNDGFFHSVIKSKALGLYRQRYCGCIYSLRENKKI